MRRGDGKIEFCSACGEEILHWTLETIRVKKKLFCNAKCHERSTGQKYLVVRGKCETCGFEGHVIESVATKLQRCISHWEEERWNAQSAKECASSQLSLPWKEASQ